MKPTLGLEAARSGSGFSRFPLGSQLSQALPGWPGRRPHCPLGSEFRRLRAQHPGMRGRPQSPLGNGSRPLPQRLSGRAREIRQSVAREGRGEARRAVGAGSRRSSRR